jgi:RNA polymerase sigma factor (TIGR02999 family)
MNEESDPPITRVLEAARAGEPGAGEALLPLVYDELRRLAERKMASEPADHTLQPTALVHEAYLRVVGASDPGWDGRRHFFAAAAEAMRRILVDHARRKASLKRGGNREPIGPDTLAWNVKLPFEDVLRIDEALQKLEAADPLRRRLVNLRFFAGLSTQDTAAALGISVWAVERQWRFIRVWLEHELDELKDSG